MDIKRELEVIADHTEKSGQRVGGQFVADVMRATLEEIRHLEKLPTDRALCGWQGCRSTPVKGLLCETHMELVLAAHR